MSLASIWKPSRWVGVCPLFGLLVLVAAAAQDVPAPRVTLRAELRVEQPHAPGTYRYLPATHVEQGQEINYTVRIANPGNEPLEGAEVVQPVPANTRYVAGSATGAGADIQFSVDNGRSFASSGELRSVIHPDRRATVDEYTHIRWKLRYPLAPRSVALARFRAVFE